MACAKRRDARISDVEKRYRNEAQMASNGMRKLAMLNAGFLTIIDPTEKPTSRRPIASPTAALTMRVPACRVVRGVDVAAKAIAMKAKA